MKGNIFIALWVVASIPATIWVASGNPDMNFFACIFWGGFIGMIATGGLISVYGQLWIGWHTPEIIEEVCDGLFYHDRRGRRR